MAQGLRALSALAELEFSFPAHRTINHQGDSQPSVIQLRVLRGHKSLAFI